MLQMKTQMEAQMEQIKHEHRKEIELIRAQATLGFRTEDQEFKEKLEVMKDEGKEARVNQQAALTSKLMAQKEGMGSPMQPNVEPDITDQ